MCIWQTYFLAATILLLQSANLISHQKALSSFTPDVLLQALLKLSNLNKNLKNLFSSQDIKVWPVSVVDRYFRWTSSFIPSATNGVKDFSQKLPPTNMSCSTCICLLSSWLWNTFQFDGQQDAPIQYGLKFGSSVAWDFLLEKWNENWKVIKALQMGIKSTENLQTRIKSIKNEKEIRSERQRSNSLQQRLIKGWTDGKDGDNAQWRKDKQLVRMVRWQKLF